MEQQLVRCLLCGNRITVCLLQASIHSFVSQLGLPALPSHASAESSAASAEPRAKRLRSEDPTPSSSHPASFLQLTGAAADNFTGFSLLDDVLKSLTQMVCLLSRDLLLLGICLQFERSVVSLVRVGRTVFVCVFSLPRSRRLLPAR